MIKFKSQLSKEEKQEVTIILQKFIDIYGDFYITKRNLRLFIPDNLRLLFSNLNHGDKIAYDENGIGIVCGFSDNAPRKYLKVLTDNMETANRIIQAIILNLDCTLFAKVKSNNPLKNVLINNGFIFYAGRGKEILLIRNGVKNDSNN